MITPPAVSPAPTGGAQLPNQFIGHYGPSPYSELTARCYHALQTPHSRSLPSSCDKSFPEAFWLQRSGQSSFPVAVILPSIGHVQVPSTSGSRRARPANKPAHHAAALFADVPMGFPICALAYLWRYPKVTDQLLGTRKSSDVSDPAAYRHPCRHADSRNRHQSVRLGIFLSRFR